MKQTIGVINYGFSGNIFNIKRAFEAADSSVKAVIVEAASDIERADKIVLPGVGSFKDAMAGIKGFMDTLRGNISKKPTLGICLGMQILAEKGYEFGETDGLAFVDGEVMKMPVKGRIPRIGWAGIQEIKSSVILKGVTAQDEFYFMHSYELVNYTDVVALAEHSGHKYVTAIEKGHIFGVQFHPEKSRDAGLRVLRNFIAV